jgi:hypothetical protein
MHLVKVNPFVGGNFGELHPTNVPELHGVGVIILKGDDHNIDLPAPLNPKLQVVWSTYKVLCPKQGETSSSQLGPDGVRDGKGGAHALTTTQPLKVFPTFRGWCRLPLVPFEETPLRNDEPIAAPASNETPRLEIEDLIPKGVLDLNDLDFLYVNPSLGPQASTQFSQARREGLGLSRGGRFFGLVVAVGRHTFFLNFQAPG